MARNTITTISAGSHPLYRIDEEGVELFICVLNDDGSVKEELRLLRSVASTLGSALLKAGDS